MDCAKAEARLSEYMESSLPAEESEGIAEHLRTCPKCSALYEEMQSVVSLCHNFPKLEINPDFLERILLRTSGRPRRRSFREILRIHLVRPMLTPRFAVGAGLAALFVFLLADLMAPRLPVVVSALSPAELFRLVDRGVQQLYGEGLKVYDKKNEWQAQINHFRDSMSNKLRFMMEQMDVPMEGKKKSEEPEKRNERSPKEKSSGLLMTPDWLESDNSQIRDCVNLV